MSQKVLEALPGIGLFRGDDEASSVEMDVDAFAIQAELGRNAYSLRVSVVEDLCFHDHSDFMCVR